MKREETREIGFIVYTVLGGGGGGIEITTLLSMKIIDFVIKDFFFIKKLRIFWIISQIITSYKNLT